MLYIIQVMQMFKNKNTENAEFELKMLFLVLAVVVFVIAFASALEFMTPGYWTAAVLGAIAVVKTTKGMRVWADQNIFDIKNPVG